MEDFNESEQIELKGDVAIKFKVQSFNCLVYKESVPVIRKPVLLKNDPVIGLTDSLLKNPTSTVSKLTFPFLVNIYSTQFHQLDQAPPQCPKCGAYLVQESFNNTIPASCPFCEHPVSCQNSHICIPNHHQEGIYIFVLVGDVNPAFYDKIMSFKQKFVLCSYSDHLTFLAKAKNGYQFLECFDSEMQPSIILSDLQQAPTQFPKSEIRKSNFNEILACINTAIPNTEIARHIIIVNELPHTCPEYFDLKNATLSVLSTNSFRCKCRSMCPLTGGLFLPHHHSLPDYITHVNKITLKAVGTSIENNNMHLTAPGFYSVINGMSISSLTEKTIQIIVERAGFSFISTFSLKPVEGLHNFLSNSQLVPFLISLNNSPYTNIIKEYTRNTSVIEFPSQLIYAPHFSSYFRYQINSINRVLSCRPFLLQIKPTLRVPQFVSEEIISNLSILLILIDYTIYIFVGGDVKRSDWREIIGEEPDNAMMSFEVLDKGLENDLWKSIRSIKEQFIGMDIPVIAVPSESGRRSEIIEELKVDSDGSNNLLLKKFGEIASAIANI